MLKDCPSNPFSTKHFDVMSIRCILGNLIEKIWVEKRGHHYPIFLVASARRSLDQVFTNQLARPDVRLIWERICNLFWVLAIARLLFTKDTMESLTSTNEFWQTGRPSRDVPLDHHTENCHITVILTVNMKIIFMNKQ